MNAGTATIQIRLAGADQLRGQLNRVNGTLRSSLGNVAKLATGFLGVQMGLQAVTGAMRSLTQGARELDKGLSKVGTLLGGQASTLLPQYRTQLLSLSSQYGIAVEKLTKPLYDLISAGVPAADAMRLLDQSIKAGLVGVADTTASVGAVTTALNAWHLETTKSTEVLDIFQAGIRTGKTTLDELNASLNRPAQLAGNLGIGLEQVIAANSSLTKQGAPTAQAMNQIAAVLRAVLQQQDRAKQMGPKIAEAFSLQALRAKGLQGFLQDLYVALDGDKTKMMELLGRAEAVNGMLGLTGKNAKMAAKDLKDVASSAGEVAKGWAVIEESPDQKIAQATQKLRNMGITIASKLLPSLAKLADAFMPLAEMLAKLIGWFTSLSPTMQKIILGTIALTAAQKKFGGAISGVLPKVQNLIGMLARPNSMGLAGGLKIAQGASGALQGALQMGLAAAIAFTTTQIIKLVGVIKDYKKTLDEIDANRRTQSENRKLLDQIVLLKEIVNHTEDEKKARKDLKEYYGLEVDSAEYANTLLVQRQEMLRDLTHQAKVQAENEQKQVDVAKERTGQLEQQNSALQKQADIAEKLTSAVEALPAGGLLGGGQNAGGLPVDSINETNDALTIQLSLWDRLYGRIVSVGDIFARRMINPLSDFFMNMMKRTKSWTDSLKALGNSVIRTIERIAATLAAKAAIFGLLSLLFPGSGIVAGGLLKFLGLAEGGKAKGFRPLGPVVPAAEGLTVTRPTLALVGEGGEDEYIIPESKMPAGGNTYIQVSTPFPSAEDAIREIWRNEIDNAMEIDGFFRK